MTAETIGCSEAERAFLGCLLRLPRSDVLRLADRMDVEDFVDPANRMLLGAAVAVAVAGQDPDPALVVLELRRRGLEHSLASHQGAGLYALEVFQAAGVPAAAGAYLQGVLEHAYRRRVQEVGTRLQQAAEAHPLEDLHELVAEQDQLLQQAWRRLWPSPHVQAVAEAS